MPVSTRGATRAVKAITFSPFPSSPLSSHQISDCKRVHHNGISKISTTLLLATTSDGVVSPEEDRRTRKALKFEEEVPTSSPPKTPSKRTPSTIKKVTPPKTPPCSSSKKRSIPPPKLTPRKRRKKVVKRSAPKDWESIYSLVEELREDCSAPVDSNGSEALPQHDLGEEVFRFQILIALMLSSQTKDMVVGDAIRALQAHGLTVENICNTPADKVNQLIQKVGFHNNKTRYIKETVKVLKEKYYCDIPPTAEEIMNLSGVGPKMAFIVENVAWGRVTGIGVDTHMHRMFNELGWVSSKNPEETRLQLESWLPKDKWKNVNYLWVGFGQEVQQFKPKMLGKALLCSHPMDALRLVKRLGLDYKKVAVKAGLEEKLQEVLDSVNNKEKKQEIKSDEKP